jgi:DNA-damage-inducible protein D
MTRLREAARKTPEGADFWRARDLAVILNYPEWRYFERAIQRARDALTQAGIEALDHIVATTKMVTLGSGSERQVGDYFLSKGACYLVAMNGDPSKPEVADAQIYFAEQAHAADARAQAEQDYKRLESRERVTKASKRVAAVAHDHGVQRFGLFHNARYEGLYEMSRAELERVKQIPEGSNLLDHLGTLELSANAFQMELASEKIVQAGKSGESHAIRLNLEVAQGVRKAMKDQIGVGPESLPTEKEAIREVKARALGKLPPKRLR